MADVLRRQKNTVLLAVVVVVVTLLLSALVAIWLESDGGMHLPSVGNIRTTGLAAYWDAELTNKAEKIPWGQLMPGSDSSATLYLRSTSNTPVTLVNTTSNWAFMNSLNETVYGPANGTDYMNLTWDYNGSSVNPGQVIVVVITLHAEDSMEFVDYVIENNVQSFSFDINIQALKENLH
jgi:hypothetical protein